MRYVARGVFLAGLVFASFALNSAGLHQAVAQEDVVSLSEPLVTIDVPDATAETTDIFIDDLQANSFTAFEDGILTLELPFTEATDSFRITVYDKESGFELFSGVYRLGPPGASELRIFDVMEVDAGFQNDLVYKPTSRSKPSENFDESDVANDFRATGSFYGERDDWTLRLDGEVVGTDDDEKTLRLGKNKVDLSDGIASLGFNNGTVNAELSVGDVYMPGGNQLVSTGFGSRGFVFKTSFLDDRISIAAGNTFGNGIQGTQRGVIAYDGDNRRSAIDASAEVLRWENLDLTLHGGILDVRRPGDVGFNIGGVPENSEENTVIGAGFELGLLGDRLRYIADFGWSTYNNADDFAGNFGDTGDEAVNHRIEASLWNEGDLSVDAYGGYSLIRPLYNSVEAFVTADRETKEVGGSVRWRMISASVSYDVFDNNVDDVASILTTRQATSSGDVSVDLEEYRYVEEGTGFSYVRLLPGSVYLNASRTKIKALNGDTIILNSSINGSEIPNQVTTTLGLGFSWNWENASTSINLSRFQLDTRQAGRDTADTDDQSIDISHSIYGDIWDASGRFALIGTRNKEITTQSTDTRYETGISFSIRPEDLPDFYASFDLSFLETQFDVEGTTALTNSWRLNTSLDLTKYIPDVIGDYQPYAKVNYQIGDSDSRDPTFGKTSQYDYSVTIALGVQF